jgi:hypothetical protein
MAFFGIRRGQLGKYLGRVLKMTEKRSILNMENG